MSVKVCAYGKGQDVPITGFSSNAELRMHGSSFPWFYFPTHVGASPHLAEPSSPSLLLHEEAPSPDQGIYAVKLSKHHGFLTEGWWR